MNFSQETIGVIIAFLALVGTAIAYTRATHSKNESEKTELIKIIIKTKKIAMEMATELIFLESTYSEFNEAHKDLYNKITEINTNNLMELQSSLDDYMTKINSVDVSKLEEQKKFAIGWNAKLIEHKHVYEVWRMTAESWEKDRSKALDL